MNFPNFELNIIIKIVLKMNEDWKNLNFLILLFMACCGGEEDRRPAKPKPRVVPTSGDTKSKLYNTENVLLKIILLGDSRYVFYLFVIFI